MTKTALLVIDMQNTFHEMVTTALPNITALIALFREQSLPVVFTRHGYTQQDVAPPVTNQLIKRWGGPNSPLLIGKPTWEFMPAIAERVTADDPVVGKDTYDAFLRTELEGILRMGDVERVVVCGVMTDCCCDTTARGAFDRGFETWLVGDACGSASEENHRRGLEAFGFAFGEVLSTEDVIERIRSEGE